MITNASATQDCSEVSLPGQASLAVRRVLDIVWVLASLLFCTHAGLAAPPDDGGLSTNLIRTENQKPGSHRLAVDPRPPRQGRLPIALDRRLLLEAERARPARRSTSWSPRIRRGGFRSRSSGWATTAAAGPA